MTMVSSFLFLLFIEKLLFSSLIAPDAVLILKSHYILEVLLKEMVKKYLLLQFPKSESLYLVQM